MMKLNVKLGYGQKVYNVHIKACGEEYCNKHLDMIGVIDKNIKNAKR